MRRSLLLLASVGLAGAAPAKAQVTAPTPPTASAATSGVLTEAQRTGYAAIFGAIRASRWSDAQAGLDALVDGPLHTVARAELYLAKGSPKVDATSLVSLLSRAPELPQAAQLARLARTRGSTDDIVLPAVQRLVWQGGQPRRARAQATRKDEYAAQLDAAIQPLIVDNQPALAEAMLTERALLLSREALAEFQQRIGWSYYIIGDDASARRIAERTRVTPGQWSIQAEWLAGLAAWRQNDCNAAAASFASVAGRASDIELAAAGHYWASRAEMMCGRAHLVEGRLRGAARYGETFYGLLAQSALAMRTAPLPDYRQAEWRRIADRPNVKAAIALAEIGERGLADEFIRHQARLNSGDHDELIHLACYLNLPETQMWLGNYAPQGSRINMAARYPMPSWTPPRGWRVDQSLALAHILQESAFQPRAVSAAGAVGLMQVRPGSAGDTARKRGEAFDPRQLTDPAWNLEYGQSHLEYLRDLNCTDGLLPKVIAAFNAGAVPVTEWNARAFDRGDPLLYIESLPYWETRGYVPIVLRNYWIYEQASGRRQSTSRDALVQGLWPRFPGMAGAPAVRITNRSYASSGASGSP